MKRSIQTLICGLGAASTAAFGAQAEQPNIVIIYGDDVGIGDVGAYGSELIPTPNIDRLAAEGLRFTDGHSAAATCTPSRFSLLTGVHGFRENVSILPPDAPLCIRTDMLTLPKLLKQAGYRTGVIGKWHLGLGDGVTPVDWNGDVKPGPMELGFDDVFLLPSTNDRVPCVFLKNRRVLNLDPTDPLYVAISKKDLPQDSRSTPYPDAKLNPEAMTYYKSTHGHNCSVINGIGRIGYQLGGKAALWNDETITETFVKQAEIFLTEHRNEPFFLYFAAQNVHVPRAPNPRFQGATKLGYRGDSMVEFDWATGELMNLLNRMGLSENTIVIFSSDNGPVYDDGYDDGTSVLTSTEESDHGHDASGIYKGGKYQIYEGGTRVPFIIRWPKAIRPAVSDALVNQIDFMASFAALLGLEIPAGETCDSRDALDALLGKDPVGHEYMIEESSGLALRQGTWKYIRAQKLPGKGNAIKNPELYNLREDPGETRNVIGQYPEKAEALRLKLEALETRHK
jgi:arylsulfatase A-like enzyme